MQKSLKFKLIRTYAGRRVNAMMSDGSKVNTKPVVHVKKKIKFGITTSDKVRYRK